MGLGKFSPGCNCCECAEKVESLASLSTSNQPAGWTVDAGISSGLWGVDDVVVVPDAYFGDHEAWSLETFISAGSFEFDIAGHTIAIDEDAGTVSIDSTNSSIFLAGPCELRVYVTPTWIGVYVWRQESGTLYIRGSVQVLDAVHGDTTGITITAKAANSQLGSWQMRSHVRTDDGSSITAECYVEPEIPCTERLYQARFPLEFATFNPIGVGDTQRWANISATITFADLGVTGAYPTETYSSTNNSRDWINRPTDQSPCSANISISHTHTAENVMGLLITHTSDYPAATVATKYPKPRRFTSASLSEFYSWETETSPGVFTPDGYTISDTASGYQYWNANGYASATLNLSLASDLTAYISTLNEADKRQNFGAATVYFSGTATVDIDVD